MFGSSPIITAIDIPLDTPVVNFDNYGALFAHEGQHALNASSAKTTLCLNEGLAVAAMDMYYNGTDSLGWLDSCAQDIYARTGVGFAGLSGDTATFYSVSFLFLRYLNAQANHGFAPFSDFYSKFYSEGIGHSSVATDALVVEEALKNYDAFKNPDGSHWTYQQAIENFRIACFKQDDTGIYGFYGDKVVKNKIGGPAFYSGPSGTSINLQPTGGIIVKTVGGSFTIPDDADPDVKYIPFNASYTRPTGLANKVFVGGKPNLTFYGDETITLPDLRIAETDESGNYSAIYNGLSGAYAHGYSLLAIRGLGTDNQTNYVLGTNTSATSIQDGDDIYIRKSTTVVNSPSDFGSDSAFIGKAKVYNTRYVPALSEQPTLAMGSVTGSTRVSFATANSYNFYFVVRSSPLGKTPQFEDNLAA